MRRGTGGGGAGVRNSRVRKRYERYWAERKVQEMAERKAKRPHLPVASLNYSIRQSLGKKNDKLFGQPTISREDWPETGAGVERKLENTRSFTTHHGCSSMKRIREITYLPHPPPPSCRPTTLFPGSLSNPRNEVGRPIQLSIKK